MKIVFAITNDIPYDQRMQKSCQTLSEAGHEVTLIGKNRNPSIELEEKKYRQIRLHTFFEKGKLFYLEYNLRLFFKLIQTKTDVYCAIDTDTLLACFLASKLRGKHLYFDAHEYFIELEEVVQRPMTKAIWKFVEDLCIPHVYKAYTISEGYAALFTKRFKKKFYVVRNIAVLIDQEPLPIDQRTYILYQGAVNHGRGLEELVEAMQFVDYKLIICGKGDIHDDLQERVQKLGLTSKVRFAGYLKPNELLSYTQQAKIGITLFANDGLSNHHSLCNRFFDYIHSGVPQIAMRYPEYALFTKKYGVAILIDQLSATNIATALKTLLENEVLYHEMYRQTLLARVDVNWQKEALVLQEIFAS